MTLQTTKTAAHALLFMKGYGPKAKTFRTADVIDVNGTMAAERGRATLVPWLTLT